MSKENIAIIDMGTNTFHLLIAEVEGKQFNFLLKEKRAIKIGKGGITKGFLSSDAYERALKTILEFKNICDKNDVKKIYATATSAVRNSRNGYQLVKDIKSKTGIDVVVISGEREAELIYHGVKSALNLGKNISLVMDIGGGSVEFILCNAETIFWKGSFEIGAQRLIDQFQNSDPISTQDTQELVDYLDEKLTTLFAAAKQYKPVSLIGSSGSFDTISEIDCAKKNINFSLEEEKEYALSFDAFERIFDELINKTREERLEIPGMIEMRVDMIVVASILIFYTINRLDIKKIRVSSYALKEGVLTRILANDSIAGQ